MIDQNIFFYIIPRNRQWGRIAAIALVLAFLVVMFQNMRSDLNLLWREHPLFAILWQLIFIVALLLMIGIILWSIAGKIILKTENRILIVEKKLFFFNWSNKFEISKLSDLQIAQKDESFHSSLFHIMTAGAFSGGLSFCYDGIRFSILKGLDSKETLPLLHKIEILVRNEISDDLEVIP